MSKSGHSRIDTVRLRRGKKSKLERVTSHKSKGGEQAGSMMSEMEQMREELAASEEKFRALFERAPLGYQSLDENGCIIEVNPAWLDLLGYEKNEVIGRAFGDFLAKGFAEVFEERFPCFKAAGEARDVEYTMVRKDGSLVEVEIDGKIGYNSDGSFRQTHCVLHDVTERKRAQEAVREKQHLNELLLNAIPHPAMLINTKRIIQAANKRAFDMGVKLGDYCWKEFYKCECLSDENKKRAEENPDDERIKCTFCLADEAMKGPELMKMNDPDVHALGKIWDTYWDPIDKETFLHYAIDITERKRAEEELRTNEKRFRELFKYMGDGVAVYEAVDDGEDFVFKDLNEAGAKIGQIKKEDVIGKTVTQVFPGVKNLGLLSIFQEVWRTGEPRHHPVSLYRDDRILLWVENHVYKLPSGDLVAVYADRTERKKAEDALIEKQRALQSLTSQLVSAEEHERKEIATGIHDEIIQALVFLDIKLKTLMNGNVEPEMLHSFEQMRKIIAELIQESRTLTFDLSNPVLNELGLEAALENFLVKYVEQKHGLKTTFADDGEPKPLDENVKICLFKAVKELVTNIVKHANARSVQVLMVKDADKIAIRVEDDGVGFDYETIYNQQGARSHYGLFSIRQRLGYLGGSIHIQSRLGRGTSVLLIAPLEGEAIRE